MRDVNDTAGATGGASAPPGQGASAADDITSIKPGTSVGRYVVLDHLGKGGMGVLYRAYDPTLERTIALKFLRTDKGGDPEQRSKDLLGEARTLANLKHPNLVRVYQCDRYEGQVFMAMELMRGDLRSWLAQPGRTWREVVQLFADAGEGLNAAHLGGQLHRDFKPANVLLDDENRPYVTDFGIAIKADQKGVEPRALASSDGGAAGATLPRAAGTAGYMSPEQMRSEKLTPQSDQFSFCVALYFGLYGQLPFGEQVIGPLPPLPNPPPRRDVPRWVHQVLAKGLSARPEDRFASMRELIDALRDDPAVRRRNRVVWSLITLALLSTAGGAAYLALREKPDERAARECREHAVEAHDQMLGPQRLEKIRDAFVAVNAKQGAADFDRVRARLEPEGHSWLDASKTACGASDPVMKKRWQTCLDERRKTLQSISAMFADADARIEEKALSTVLAEVIPSGSCMAGKDAENGSFGFAIASDDPLYEKLERARLLLVAGKDEEATDLTLELADEATEKQDVPLQAEAQLLLGEIYTERSHPAAGDYLKRAINHAESLGNDHLRERATLTLSTWYVNRREQRHWLDASDELHKAEAILDRLGGNPLLHARVLSQRGRLAQAQGHVEEARRNFAEALELLNQLLQPDHPLIANAKSNLAVVLEPGEGVKVFTEVLESKKALYGPEHPEVASALHNRALKKLAIPDCAGALADIDAAIAIRERTMSYDPGRLGRSHAVRSAALACGQVDDEGTIKDEIHDRGRLEESLHERTQAIELLELGRASDEERVHELKKLKQLQCGLKRPKTELEQTHAEIVKISGTSEADPTAECP